jgi:hypothetical protein
MNKLIKIFTMQKDEDDILENWIIYHSKIVGYENLYIIDNNSKHSSLKILEKYDKINVYFKSDYKLKGKYILELIKNNPCDIAIPIDIDEFISIDDLPIYPYNENNIKKILNELNSLPNYSRYSFKYYLTSVNDKLYYNDPIKEIKKFTIVNNKHNNKKFFIQKYLIDLDHGNHHGKVTNLSTGEYYISKLVLFHYHYRGVLKLIEKCKNDILGLNIIKNINDLNELNTAIENKVIGSHNIIIYKKYLLYGPYSLL